MSTTSGELNIRNELFCQYYVKNKDARGNGTLSYALAYDYDLDSLPTDDGVIELVDGTTMTEMEYEDSVFKGTIQPQKYRKIQQSSKQKAELVCAVNASKLLRVPKVNDRIKQLYNELLNDNEVDSVLSEIIHRGYKDSDRVSAIKEYNALKARIVKKIDHTSLGKSINPMSHLSDEELRAIANGNTKNTSTDGVSTEGTPREGEEGTGTETPA